MQDLADPDKRIVGLKQVIKGIERDMFCKIYIASDVDEVIRQKVILACNLKGMTYEEDFSMAELGSACEIEVSAATAGVLK